MPLSWDEIRHNAIRFAKDGAGVTAIFGSLFQAVMEPKERRQIGGHYTSKHDILIAARSLFLNELSAEFAHINAAAIGNLVFSFGRVVF